MISRRMQIFLKVAETGSFSKAAEQLYITASAVVQQMNTLEADLHCHLMNRTNKGIRLTPAGERLLHSGTKIVQEWDSLARELSHFETEERIIRLGTHMLYKSTCFKQMWPDYHAVHSDIRLDIQYYSFYEKKLSGIDFMEGVDFIGETDEGWHWEYLGKTPLVILVAPNHPLAGAQYICLEDLRPYTLISVSLQNRMSPVLAQFNRDAQNAGVQIETALIYDPPLFDRCEMENLVLQIPLIWADLAPNMSVVPLRESYCLRYGFLVSDGCSHTAKTFLNYVAAQKPHFDFLLP